MSYTPEQARPLLDSDEFQLFSDSFESAEKLTAIDLKLAIRRCRSAQDKYLDLQQRQAGMDYEEAAARGVALDADTRAADKAALFAEALTRYEQRLAAVD